MRIYFYSISNMFLQYIFRFYSYAYFLLLYEDLDVESEVEDKYSDL